MQSHYCPGPAARYVADSVSSPRSPVQLTAQDEQAEPNAIKRRGSLSNIFQSVRTKLGRERSSTNNEDVDFVRHARGGHSRSSSDDAYTSASGQSTRVHFEGVPPRLEILPETSQSQFQTPSAFTDSIEQATNDINIKYGVSYSQKPTNDSDQCLSHTPDQIQLDETFKSFVLDRNSHENSLPKTTPLIPCETAPGAYAGPSNFRHRPRHGKGSGVPVHWLDKVLEQSILLRTPREESAAKERLPSAATKPRMTGIATNGSGHQLRRTGAIYISATARKNRKIAGPVEGKGPHIQNIYDWPFPSESSTTDCSVSSERYMDGLESYYTHREADSKPSAIKDNPREEGWDLPGTSSAAYVGLATTTSAPFPSMTNENYSPSFPSISPSEPTTTTRGCLNGAFDNGNSDDDEEEWNNYMRLVSRSQGDGHQEKWNLVVGEVIASRRKYFHPTLSQSSEDSAEDEDEKPSKGNLDTGNSMCDTSWADSYGGHLV